MSTAKENSCRKFQANIFNKSKCQNCFKPRELHLLTDQDLNQAKPIYGGWLCLAPEGTDFGNPMQRSRKWQRRFFVLYEHGCLRFALDESSSTLPQGTVNLNLCTDVMDAEPKTGQKNALCIVTPEQEYFIRGENKEIINGWTEQLVIYPRTNKQNQKKKRKVEPTTSQEPGPAKVAVKGSGIPEAGSENVPDSSSIIWQEELSHREAEGVSLWPAPDLPRLGSPQPSTGDCGSVARGSDAGSVNGDEVDRSGLHGSVPLAHHNLLSPTGSSLGGVPHCFSPLPSDPFPSGSSLLSNGSHISGSVSSLDSDASGNTVASTESHLAGRLGLAQGGRHDTPRSRRLEAEARKAEKRSRVRSPGEEREAVFSPEKSRSGVIEKLEALELENPERMEVEEAGRTGARQGRSEHRRFHTEDLGQDFPSTLPPLRRAKSLDRRTTESVMTPDLLNFKKGWMVKLDEHGQWKKFWFVLTDHSLRYYKDSIAEEASDLDGEIDLSTCYNVTEYQAQRNYGFQIHTQEGMHTLSAMTAGIRRNWIQAVMKNVRPSTAPDVASNHSSFSPLEGLFQPDVTQDSPSSETSSVEREPGPGPKKSRARERRQQGRSKTFDWGEFRPIAQALAQQRAQKAEPLQTDIGDPDRNRRREERRRRYESVTGSSKDQPAGSEGGRMDFEKGGGSEGSPGGECGGPPSLERQQKVEEEIEQHWQQVEQTPIRDERRVPLPSTLQTRETAELEKLLESYKKGVEELKLQLGSCHQQLLHSNQHKQNLEVQLRTALERESMEHVRSGYVSQLELPLVLEADIEPQTKRPELATCERGFAAMEESHQRVIEELQRKNQRALENLHEEKERLLAEETAATISAIEAMKNAHRSELEKELDKARKSNSNTENADIEEICRQHEEELCSFQREIEVLSEQYSQKCLENAHLAQALEAERQALRQCQRENQELNAHNQELNNRLAAEITKIRSMAAEDGGGNTCNITHGKELYELEVSSAPGELYELEVSSAPGELYELEVSSAPGELYELEVSSAPGELYELEVSSAPGELYELEVSSAPGELYELEVSSAPGELYELEVSSAPGELYELEVSSAPGEQYELEVSSAPGELYELEVSSAPGELYELEVSSAPGELYELEVSSAPGELYELEVSSAPGELYELEVSSAPGELYELEVSSAPGELYELEVSSAPGELYELEVSSAPGELYELEVSSAPGELYELEVSSAPGELYELEVSSAPGELYELEVSSAPGELYELEVSSAPGELYELEVSSAPGELYELEVSSAPGELYELEVSSAPGELYELEVSSAPGELYELEVSSAPGELYELEVSSAPGELYELEVSSAPGELYELEVSSAPGEQYELEVSSAPGELYELEVSSAPGELYELEVSSAPGELYELEVSSAPGELYELEVSSAPGELYELEVSSAPGELYELEVSSAPGELYELEVSSAPGELYELEVSSAPGELYELEVSSAPGELYELEVSSAPGEQYELEVSSAPGELYELEVSSAPGELYELEVSSAPGELYELEVSSAPGELYELEVSSAPGELYELEVSSAPGELYELEVSSAPGELYELEVMLRVKESEVQYLKQEINSLKDELQAAQRDKKNATDKYRDIYTELSIVRAKAERDLGRLREQLQLAHEALGEPSLEEVERAGGYDIMKSKSNPDILKMAAAAAKRTERTMRSKSLKEGLTAEQRLHLFDKDTKEF
ncbi:myosin phosphatase Rho-interacting protein-like isoform X2 [Salvelinus namaycush]|uniref:Myosin phosphatase Rho-interacting protein-like isoform X2 n=1 Tax=Salvelinus namaycush TaxID=8040 RepID=A0A8U0QQX0_SALNM|nr:myosin phosphatase Rho-interacting protein-like isoform X2 [Salvelinus namaycush]